MLFTAKCKEAETNCICTIGGASFEAGSGPSRAAPRVEVGETLIGAVQLQETGITRCVGALAFLLRVEVSKKLVDCKKFLVLHYGVYHKNRNNTHFCYNFTLIICYK